MNLVNLEPKFAQGQLEDISKQVLSLPEMRKISFNEEGVLGVYQEFVSNFLTFFMEVLKHERCNELQTSDQLWHDLTSFVDTHIVKSGGLVRSHFLSLLRKECGDENAEAFDRMNFLVEYNSGEESLSARFGSIKIVYVTPS